MHAGAGTTSNDNSPAPPNDPPIELAQTATHVRRCAKCQSHFASDFEEPLCAACVEWAELYSQLDEYSYAVRGTRGGRQVRRRRV